MLKFKLMEKIAYCRPGPKKKGGKLPFLYTPVTSVREARKDRYPIVVIDYKFLKQRKNTDFSFIKDKISLLYFSEGQKLKINQIRKLGFFDYFFKGSKPAEIKFKLKKAQAFARIKERGIQMERRAEEEKRNSQQFCLRDSLTGSHNWRYFLEEARRQLVRSKRYGERVSFIGIDIDRFRQINEIYGIEVADKVIKEMVALLAKNLRKGDILSRWREDEFFIIAPYLDKKNLYPIVCRLKDTIASHKFKCRHVRLQVKVSIGAVSFPEDSVSSPKDVAIALDRAVSKAKRKGGNTIVVSSWPQPKAGIKKKNQVNIKEMRDKVEKLSILLSNDILDVIYGFARAIEAKDAYTGSHIEYTAVIAKKIAKELKLPQNEIDDIEHAAVLHDLGKVGIDEKILSKKGELSTKERQIIKSHPSIASEILKDIQGLRGAVPGVLYHHERFDGTGYPLGLKGDEIPLAARIVAVADVFQALTSDRPYRKAYSKREAIKIIKAESGSHFDPKIIKIFLKII